LSLFDQKPATVEAWLRKFSPDYLRDNDPGAGNATPLFGVAACLPAIGAYQLGAMRAGQR
jgi:hypothetical protein